jgi:uncharacterized membrane protein YhhN
MRFRWLPAVSLILSTIYILTAGFTFPGRAAVKAGSIALLGCFALLNARAGVGAGLLISSVGDFLLDLPGMFAAGLGAFLTAHLVYAATFVRGMRRDVPLGRGRLAAIGCVLAFALGFGGWIAPAAGPLEIPVVLYIAAITTMVVSSIAARFESNWVPVGAVLFLISDAVLATNRFRTAIPMRDYIVWCTYYAGQFLIAWGSVEHNRTVAVHEDAMVDVPAHGAR